MTDPKWLTRSTPSVSEESGYESTGFNQDTGAVEDSKPITQELPIWPDTKPTVYKTEENASTASLACNWPPLDQLQLEQNRLLNYQDRVHKTKKENPPAFISPLLEVPDDFDLSSIVETSERSEGIKKEKNDLIPSDYNPLFWTGQVPTSRGPRPSREEDFFSRPIDLLSHQYSEGGMGTNVTRKNNQVLLYDDTYKYKRESFTPFEEEDREGTIPKTSPSLRYTPYHVRGSSARSILRGSGTNWYGTMPEPFPPPRGILSPPPPPVPWPPVPPTPQLDSKNLRYGTMPVPFPPQRELLPPPPVPWPPVPPTPQLDSKNLSIRHADGHHEDHTSKYPGLSLGHCNSSYNIPVATNADLPNNFETIHPSYQSMAATSTRTPHKTPEPDDTAVVPDTGNVAPPTQDIFETLQIHPDTRYIENLLKMQQMTEDLKAVLRSVLYRPDASWAEEFLMMGLDNDLRFKVWVPNKYKSEILREIQNILHNEREKVAAEYLSKLDVIGSRKELKLERDAGISLVPGQTLFLNLTTGKQVKLTAFFVADTQVYAVSTTHEENRTGMEVFYKTFEDDIALGKIVLHVSETNPFMEACLIQIFPEQLKNVSEFVSENAPTFIYDVYTGDIQNIPVIRQQGLMKCGPNHFKHLTCRSVRDIKNGRDVLKDAVVWTSNEHAGGPGQSGSPICGKTADGNIELISLYIGRITTDEEVLLISHAMQPTLCFFSEWIGQDLRVLNPITKPNVVGDIPHIANGEGPVEAIDLTEEDDGIEENHHENMIHTILDDSPSTNLYSAITQPIVQRDVKLETEGKSKRKLGIDRISQVINKKRKLVYY